MLIENGRLHRAQPAKELVTESELLTVAHRQGFSRPDEVESCVLEPGGTFFLQCKARRPEQPRASRPNRSNASTP